MVCFNHGFVVGARQHPHLIGVRQHVPCPLPANLRLRSSIRLARIGRKQNPHGFSVIRLALSIAVTARSTSAITLSSGCEASTIAYSRCWQTKAR